MVFKYLEVAEDIREKIKSGEYPRGYKIPVEMTMCEEYGVSRITIQKAMKVLGEEGYVSRVSGKGTFVNQDILGDNPDDGSAFTFVIFPKNEDGFFDIIHGIENELMQLKSLCSLHFLGNNEDAANDNEKLEAMLMSLLKYKPKGIIIYPSNSTIGASAYKAIQKKGISLVLLDKECYDVPTDGVVVDNYEGMKTLTQHVIDQGHKKIAYLSFQMEFGDSLVKRRKAFYDTMHANGLEVCEEICDCSSGNLVEIRKTVYGLIRENLDFTAVICANDCIAGICYELFGKYNISIPDDISVCSFDGHSIFRGLEPKLTSVMQNLDQMGRMAARLVMMRQKDSALSKDMTIKFTLPTILLEGASVKNIKKT